MGERHVVSFIGLPARGKQFMAERLRLYLDFFHGAHCEVFDIAEPHLDSDEKVFSALQTFLEQEDEQASRQLLKATSGLEDEALERLKKNVDSGQIALLDTHDAFNTHERIWSGSSKERRWKMQNLLDQLQVKVKLLFIEVIVTDPGALRRPSPHLFSLALSPRSLALSPVVTMPSSSGVR